MTRLYDRLPFEVAQALAELVKWRQETLAGRHVCASSQLSMLERTTDNLIEWQESQPSDTRVLPEVFTDTATHRLAADRVRHNSVDRPRLHLVPVPPKEPTDPKE